MFHPRATPLPGRWLAVSAKSLTFMSLLKLLLATGSLFNYAGTVHRSVTIVYVAILILWIGITIWILKQPLNKSLNSIRSHFSDMTWLLLLGVLCIATGIWVVLLSVKANRIPGVALAPVAPAITITLIVVLAHGHALIERLSRYWIKIRRSAWAKAILRNPTLVTSVGFFIVLAFILPVLLEQARVADERQDHAITTDNDDYTYQVPAVNLLYGKGYSESINLPLETYNLNLNSETGRWIAEQYERNKGEPFIINTRFATLAEADLYRAPGLTMLLSVAYSILGNTSLVARSLLAVLVWLTAIMFLVMGHYLAGWIGALSGGITALIYVGLYGLIFFGFEGLLTEIPSAFWVTLFCLIFFIYLKKRQTIFVLLSALALIPAIYTRVNFIVVFPLIGLYLVLINRRLKETFLFSSVVLIPIALWTSYASASVGRLIAFTTQGEIAFPECNNIDVLEGIGSEHLFQGAWNPGWQFDERGNLISDGRHSVRPGENGWAKGFAFWRENLLQLPRLFYAKLQAGFWSQLWYFPASIGICFLLMTLGFRLPKNRARCLPSLNSQHILRIQLFLIVLFVVMWDNALFFIVLLIYLLLLVIALLRPYGDLYLPPFPTPVFFLAYVASHFATTLIFVGQRYHEPLDPMLIFIAALGFLTTLQNICTRVTNKSDDMILRQLQPVSSSS